METISKSWRARGWVAVRVNGPPSRPLTMMIVRGSVDWFKELLLIQLRPPLTLYLSRGILCAPDWLSRFTFGSCWPSFLKLIQKG